jgi:hypothetical protein
MDAVAGADAPGCDGVFGTTEVVPCYRMLFPIVERFVAEIYFAPFGPFQGASILEEGIRGNGFSRGLPGSSTRSK